MSAEPQGRRKVVSPFEVDDEWVSSLPFERAPRGITHLPLECVVYVPSTQGDDAIDVEGFGDADDYERKRRQLLEWLLDKRDEWGQEALGFEFEGDLWYL